RGPEPCTIRRRLAQGDRPPPRSSADESGRDRDLAHRPACPLRPAKRAVDERSEGSPQRELVANRLRELDPLDDLGRWTARVDPIPRPTARQAPRVPPLRSEPLGDCRAREPSELAERPDAESFELPAAVLLD